MQAGNNVTRLLLAVCKRYNALPWHLFLLAYAIAMTVAWRCETIGQVAVSLVNYLSAIF